MNIQKSEQEIKNIKPLHDNILLKVKELEDKTPFGIYIPQGSINNMTVILEGEVIAIGPGYYNAYLDSYSPVSVKPGDIVLFSPYGELNMDVPMNENKVTYKIVPDKCIKAIIHSS